MFKIKNPEKHTLAGRTSPLSPYRGVHPAPRLITLYKCHDFNCSALMTNQAWIICLT